MNGSVQNLMRAFHEAATRHYGSGRARVACKVNARGELVIGVIVSELAVNYWRRQEESGELPPGIP